MVAVLHWHSCPARPIRFHGCVRPEAEDVIRTAHCVPPAERGRADYPVLGAEEVLASLEDRERDAMAMEADGHARLGTVRLRNLEEEQLTVEHVEQEVDELTSTGLMNTDKEGEFSLQDRLREMRSAMDTGGISGYRRGADSAVTNTLVTEGQSPAIVNRRGEDIADSNDPEFDPKTFPCLFPWGLGGPKNLREHNTDDDGHGNRDRNFTLRWWARQVLQRHGKYRV